MVGENQIECRLCGAPVDRVRDLEWTRDGFEILRCLGCGLLFRSNPPRAGELKELYGEGYFRATDADGQSKGEGYPDYIKDEELHRKNARARLGLIDRFVDTGRLLDVGCAAGFFADEARNRGWDTTGVELSPTMAAYARDRLGLDVVEMQFARSELSGPYDAVTMWDYIEHSLDPVVELRHAYSLLRPGGVVALSTGDAGSLVARLSGRRWHLLTPRHHNYFFDRRTVERALTEVGLEPRHAGTLASRYSIHYLAHKLQTMGTPLAGRLSRALEGTRLGSVSIPVNIFDIVTVVAQRPLTPLARPCGAATPS